MPRTHKSTAKPWAGSKTLGSKYRDWGTAYLPDGSSKPVDGYGPTKTAATTDLYRMMRSREKRA